MKPGCQICASNGNTEQCTCSKNCMMPSCQWKISLKTPPQPSLIIEKIVASEPVKLPTPQPKPVRTHLGPHDHPPPIFTPFCDCPACQLYVQMALDNASGWPDPIEHLSEGDHYWGDTHFNKEPGPSLDVPPSKPKEKPLESSLTQLTLGDH